MIDCLPFRRKRRMYISRRWQCHSQFYSHIHLLHIITTSLDTELYFVKITNWLSRAMLNSCWGRFETRVYMNKKIYTRIKIFDFKLSPCCECCGLSFAWFSDVWVLRADVSERPVCSIFICTVNRKKYIFRYRPVTILQKLVLIPSSFPDNLSHKRHK